MKLLVTGAGYLGGEIMKLADAAGVQVLGSSRKVSSEVGNQSMIYLDVLDPGSFSHIPSDITHVVYSVSAGESSEAAYREVYVNGLSNILNYFRSRKGARPLKNFTFISSTGVYSEDDGGLVTEDSPLGGESFRSYIIREGEEILQACFSESDFLERFLILRFSGIYGLKRRSLYDLACSMTQAEVPLRDSLTNRIHVHDGARACLFLMPNSEGIFNISDSCPVPRLEVINFIRQMNGLGALDIRSESSPGGKGVSNLKVLNSGFSFLYPSFKEGYKGYRAHF